MIAISITNGPSFKVAFASNMNAEDALRAVYNQNDTLSRFSYATQYFGAQYGNLIIMINETYESFPAKNVFTPFYYWEFILNGFPATKGIDNTPLQDNDVLEFSFIPYSQAIPTNSTVHAKHTYKAF